MSDHHFPFHGGSAIKSSLFAFARMPRPARAGLWGASFPHLNGSFWASRIAQDCRQDSRDPAHRLAAPLVMRNSGIVALFPLKR